MRDEPGLPGSPLKVAAQEKGIVRRFLIKATGLSRAQLTRLIRRWRQTRKIERRPPRRPCFATRYTADDIPSFSENWKR